MSTENVSEHPNIAIDGSFTVENAIDELNEEGAGGDSDDEDSNFLNDIHNAAAESSRYRLEELQFDETAVLDEGNEMEIE